MFRDYALSFIIGVALAASLIVLVGLGNLVQSRLSARKAECESASHARCALRRVAGHEGWYPVHMTRER